VKIEGLTYVRHVHRGIRVYYSRSLKVYSYMYITLVRNKHEIHADFRTLQGFSAQLHDGSGHPFTILNPATWHLVLSVHFVWQLSFFIIHIRAISCTAIFFTWGRKWPKIPLIIIGAEPRKDLLKICSNLPSWNHYTLKNKGFGAFEKPVSVP
jgi:hypothetical protein